MRWLIEVFLWLSYELSSSELTRKISGPNWSAINFKEELWGKNKNFLKERPNIVATNFPNLVERFAIQPYQFKPRNNADEAEFLSLSGLEANESDEERVNPRLENSDWYVAMLKPIDVLNFFQWALTSMWIRVT